VPGKELSGLCVNKGPIKFFAVGNNVLEAKQEWICNLKLKNGDYQLVQGLTIDKVTCPMPMIKTEEVLKELKNSKPDDHVLQNCCAPAIIGGEIDMIIGIRYNRIAPELIHQLPYGLAIYSIYMGTHNPAHNSAIGGLHESF
jgi:hypothetical protein